MLNHIVIIVIDRTTIVYLSKLHITIYNTFRHMKFNVCLINYITYTFSRNLNIECAINALYFKLHITHQYFSYF